MTQLIVLVVAAAWLAVLIPPMLRSRVENRPNSSVTDFRRQLDKLQDTSTPRPGMRAMGRPLAPTGLGRSARPARPERPVLRSGVVVPQRTDLDRSGDEVDDPRPIDRREPVRTGGGRYRSHGDTTSSMRRPDPYADSMSPSARSVERRPDRIDPRRDRRAHTAPNGMSRPVDGARRRRSNVLFLLAGITVCTLFLAATTSSTAMFYAFAVSFLALFGYIYLLAQANQRGNRSYDGWLDRY